MGVKGHIRKVHGKKEADETQRKRKNASDFFKEDEGGEKRQKLEDKECCVEKFLKEIATYWDEADDSEKEGIESNDTFPSFPSLYSSKPGQTEINTLEEARLLLSR